LTSRKNLRLPNVTPTAGGLNRQNIDTNRWTGLRQ